MTLVAQDGSGVRTALLELLEEGFRHRATRASLEKVGDDLVRRAKIFAQLPVRTLAPGYYAWAEYLFYLDDVREAGITLSALTRDEAEGVRHLRAARSEFEHKHPCCFACGTRQQSRFVPECMSCHQKLTGRAA